MATKKSSHEGKRRIKSLNTKHGNANPRRRPTPSLTKIQKGQLVASPCLEIVKRNECTSKEHPQTARTKAGEIISVKAPAMSLVIFENKTSALRSRRQACGWRRNLLRPALRIADANATQQNTFFWSTKHFVDPSMRACQQIRFLSSASHLPNLWSD